MLPRQSPIVSIGAYCLMKNHYHILIQEIVEGGITKFMQKLGTGYAMYFNQKHDRIGNLFLKPFRSKHINTDAYLRKVTQYIHLNPCEMFEAGFKEGKVRNLHSLLKKLEEYPFSSLQDYLGRKRPENEILDPTAIKLLRQSRLALNSTIGDALEYYRELEHEF